MNSLALQVGDVVRAVAKDGRRFRMRFDGYQDFTAVDDGIQPQFTAIDEIPGLVSARSTTYGHRVSSCGFTVAAGVAA